LKSIIPHSYARFIPHHTTDARHRRHGTTARHQSTDCVPQHTQLWLLLHCAYTHACAHPVMASHSKMGGVMLWWFLVGFTCVCGGAAPAATVAAGLTAPVVSGDFWTVLGLKLSENHLFLFSVVVLHPQSIILSDS